MAEASEPGLGEMDLAELTATALAAILAHPEGARHPDHAATLVAMLSNNTRTVAERTFAEFDGEPSWTVELRQARSLNAIVLHVIDTKAILTPFGEAAQTAVTHLVRETYFARLAEVALGARPASGTA